VQILTILYKSELSPAEVDDLFRERATRYIAVDGLVGRMYVRDPSTGQVGGIYLFDNHEHLEMFRRSALLASFGDAYRFAEHPTVRAFDVVMAIRGGESSGDTPLGSPSRQPGIHRTVFGRVIDEGFNQGRVDGLDALFAPGFIDHQPGIEPPTLEGVKAFIRGARAAFPDLVLTIDQVTSTGDTLWARTTARGTHHGPFMTLSPTGRSFTVTRFDVCRFEHGRIAEHWGVVDRLGVLQQLGARDVLSPGSTGLGPGRQG
jgi:predicted ester cyclase